MQLTAIDSYLIKFSNKYVGLSLLIKFDLWVDINQAFNLPTSVPLKDIDISPKQVLHRVKIKLIQKIFWLTIIII